MKLTIDRSRWYRGPAPLGGDEPRLLNKEGRMCCLGFLALACGYSETEIDDVAYPWTCRGGLGAPGRMPETIGRQEATDVGVMLTTANDSNDISEEERERRIASLMAEAGIEVEFVDGPVSP